MTEKYIENLKRRAFKNVAVILSIILLSVMLFSAFYVISEMNHSCSEGDCPICAHIHQLEAMLRSAGDGTTLTALTALMILAFAIALSAPCAVVLCSTPVTCKVRLNR